MIHINEAQMVQGCYHCYYRETCIEKLVKKYIFNPIDRKFNRKKQGLHTEVREELAQSPPNELENIVIELEPKIKRWKKRLEDRPLFAFIIYPFVPVLGALNLSLAEALVGIKLKQVYKYDIALKMLGREPYYKPDS